MRYIIQFKDQTSKRLSEKDAKFAMDQMASGSEAIIIKGAYFKSSFINCIKPITKDWFDSETASRESPEEMQSIGEVLSDRKTLEFQKRDELKRLESKERAYCQ